MHGSCCLILWSAALTPASPCRSMATLNVYQPDVLPAEMEGRGPPTMSRIWQRQVWIRKPGSWVARTPPCVPFMLLDHTYDLSEICSQALHKPAPSWRMM